MSPDVRFIPCDFCGTEGRIVTETMCFPYQDRVVDHGPCQACDGTGEELVAVEPVTLADLEEMEAA